MCSETGGMSEGLMVQSGEGRGRAGGGGLSVIQWHSSYQRGLLGGLSPQQSVHCLYRANVGPNLSSVLFSMADIIIISYIIYYIYTYKYIIYIYVYIYMYIYIYRILPHST